MSIRYCATIRAAAGSPIESIDDLSFETWVRDLECVVEAAGFRHFSMVGTCWGGPIAIEYAARHPERVTHLVLYGTYARGTQRRGNASK